MRRFSGESFEVSLEEITSTIKFKGTLRLTGTQDYAPILEMLRIPLGYPQRQIVVDLRELDFLNSSGITMFSRFVIEARDSGCMDLQVVASESVPWHGRSLKNLQRLMPSLRIQMT